MSRKLSKIAAAMMAAILTVSLAACGNQNAPKTNNESTPQPTQQSNTASAEPQKEKLEPVTLRFYFPGDKPLATDDVWKHVSELTKDTLNATFEINFVNWNDYNNKLKLLQSSGDNYDMNFDGNWQDYNNAMTRGGYMDITDLLPQYAPKLYQVYTEKNLLDPIKVNGRIYAAPWTVLKTNKPNAWYRGDLGVKGGYTKDKIETIEDADAYLRAAKKADPSVIPLSWRPDTWNNTIAGMLIAKYEYEDLNFNGLIVKINDPEHKVIPWEQTEAFKEYVYYAKKWNDEGLIPKNLLATKGTEGSFDGGTFAFAAGNIDGCILENEHDFKPEVEAQGAVKAWSEMYPANKWVKDSPLGNIVCINTNAANPERAIMLLEELSTNEEVYDAVIYGIKDVTYKIDNRVVSYMPDQGNGNPTNYLDWNGQWGFWREGFQKLDSARTQKYFDTYNEYVNRPTMINSTVNYFVADQSAIKTEMARRNQVFDEVGKLLSVGIVQGDIDQAIATYVAKQKAAGTDAIVTEVQKQLDAFMAGK